MYLLHINQKLYIFSSEKSTIDEHTRRETRKHMSRHRPTKTGT